MECLECKLRFPVSRRYTYTRCTMCKEFICKECTRSTRKNIQKNCWYHICHECQEIQKSGFHIFGKDIRY